VDLETFEDIGVQAVIGALKKADLIVIDEIGKMELFSHRFQTVLFEVLEGPRPLLGTIVAKAHPVADRIKAHAGVRLQRLTPANRHEVADVITADLMRWLAD
jgi:nucleoside-triphosphatase THEP1